MPIKIKIVQGFIFVCLNPDAPNRDEMFDEVFQDLQNRSPMLHRLRFAKRFTAEVDGNWKIMIENYLECYHCTPTHPALIDLMKIKEFKVKCSSHYIVTSAPAGRTDNTAYHYTLNQEAHKEFLGWWLWPNLTFNIFPGQPNLLAFHMLPISPEKAIGICDYFFIDGKINEEAQALMDWESNVLEKEDNELIVSAHKGMKSKALSHGVFVVDSLRNNVTEAPLVLFNQLVSTAIQQNEKEIA